MTRTKIKCELCDREIIVNNYSRHLRSHENGNFDKFNNMIHLDHDDLLCKYCGKECKNRNSLAQHEIRCRENPNPNHKSNNSLSAHNNKLKGKFHNYVPDFYLPDYDIYLEPKNSYLIENINRYLGFYDLDKLKWASEQNNVKIILLTVDELTWDSIKKKINNEEFI